MQKEDWQRIAKWIGVVYLPIIILIVIVFGLVEWNAYKLSTYGNALKQDGQSTSTVSTQDTN